MIIEKIEEVIKSSSLEVPRDYLGASLIGHDCTRRIWLEYNHYPREKIPAKTQLIFKLGHKIEDMIRTLLMTSALPLRYNVLLEAGSLKGHCDALSPTFVLEIKSANQSSFAQFQRHGLKKWNNQYYAQIQSYMGMAQVDRGIMLVVNKNTCEMAEESVEFDKNYYQYLLLRADAIVNLSEIPEGVSKSGTYFLCKMCPFYQICFNQSARIS